eukprot:SAG31_NODE_12274_length_953_cov_1.213115_1_plen_80_part_00
MAALCFWVHVGEPLCLALRSFDTEMGSPLVPVLNLVPVRVRSYPRRSTGTYVPVRVLISTLNGEELLLALESKYVPLVR